MGVSRSWRPKSEWRSDVVLRLCVSGPCSPAVVVTLSYDGRDIEIHAYYPNALSEARIFVAKLRRKSGSQALESATALVAGGPIRL